MEIRIIAKKDKSVFKRKDSTLGTIMTETKETYFPLLELILQELKNEQEQMRSENLKKEIEKKGIRKRPSDES